MKITLPAYAADTLGESITIEAPDDWSERIRALAPWLPYGPNHSRGVLSSLREVDDLVRRGYSMVAYDRLCDAEAIAKRHPIPETW